MVIKDEKRLKRLKREAEKLESELAIKPYSSWRPELIDDVKALEKIRYGEDGKDYERYFLWHSTRGYGTGFPTGTGSLGKVIMLRDAVKQIKKRLSLTKKLRRNALGKFLAKNNLSDTEVFILATVDLRTGYYSNEALIKNLLMYGFDKEKIEKCLSDESQLFKNNLIRLENDAYHITYKAMTGLEGEPYTKDWEELDEKHEEDSGKNSICEVIDPKISMENIVLDDRTKKQVELVIAQVNNQNIMFKVWKVGGPVDKKGSMNMFFSGSPGVGKSILGEAVAKRLGKKLFKVNYAQLQNCYVGQTEKNIEEVFRSGKGQVIFFDEVDALVQNRSNLCRSWEFSQVNTFLSLLEKHEGVVILASNLPIVLDPAISRRLTTKIHIGLPDAEARLKIWKIHLGDAPLVGDVNLKKIAEEYQFSGGDIKNAVLTAARMAVIDGKEIRMEHLVEACEIIKQGDEIMKKNCLGG